MRTLICFGIAAALICTGSACVAGSATFWSDYMYASGAGGFQSQFSFGTAPGAVDGYDAGMLPDDWTQRQTVHIKLYRETGWRNWTGPTGFYGADPETPVPDGGSKTWWDIYLWSYNYTPPLGNRGGVGCNWTTMKPPAGYTGILTIDYVPADLDWTGPYELRIDLNKGISFLLPVPITGDPTDPANVTRMHLTVYTYPIPEPSSLAAIGLALAGVGIGVVRRRRG